MNEECRCDRDAVLGMARPTDWKLMRRWLETWRQYVTAEEVRAEAERGVNMGRIGSDGQYYYDGEGKLLPTDVKPVDRGQRFDGSVEFLNGDIMELKDVPSPIADVEMGCFFFNSKQQIVIVMAADVRLMTLWVRSS